MPRTLANSCPALAALMALLLLTALPAVAAPTSGSSPVLADSVIGPDYTDAPELTTPTGTPRGAVHEFTMDSADSRIFPGIAKDRPGVVVPYRRHVWVYLPAGYVPGTPAPLLVVQDGGGYRDTLPPILDTLIAARRVPPLVAVLADSGGGDAQGSERGLEYDTLSDAYARFVQTELLPAVSAQYGVRFTRDPEGRASMGGSSGAAAAFTMAWYRPDLFRRVLSYSGTFVDQESPKSAATPNGAWEYHEHLLWQSPRKPLRAWLEVGERDNGWNRPEASLHNWVLANRRMAGALAAKGYPYRFVFARGAGHVDRRVVRQTLPAALEWLWQGYRPAE